MELSPVYFGSDHAGYNLKNQLVDYLKGKGHRAVDLGVFSEESVDYPDIAREVGEKVQENHGAVGVLICGTGIGMCMAVNKLKGIRGANCENENCVTMARRHNDANVLCIGGRVLPFEEAKKLVDIFLTEKFEAEERHVRRVKKMDQI